MDSQLRSNGSSTKPATQAVPRPAARSKLAGRVDRVLNTAVAGERAAVLNVAARDLLLEPEPVAGAIHEALERRGVGVIGHFMAHELLRRSELHDALLDALAGPDPATRAAAARLCGAARLADATLWIGDMLDDSDPRVREAAVRSLAQLGGHRSVDLLVAAADRVPLHRLAIALSLAASDIDVEALIRRPASERAALATVLACGLRRDVLRVAPLLGIAHDRRWPQQVRIGACKALAAIADRSAADGLHRLAESEPDPVVKRAAERAHRRLIRRAVAR